MCTKSHVLIPSTIRFEIAIDQLEEASQGKRPHQPAVNYFKQNTTFNIL